MKTFGKVIAIQTSGPDAVEELDEARAEVEQRLSRHQAQTFSTLHILGYEVDVDTYQTTYDFEEDRILIGWLVQARQTRNLIQRILWAVKL